MDLNHPKNDPEPTNILFISSVKIIYQLQKLIEMNLLSRNTYILNTYVQLISE